MFRQRKISDLKGQTAKAVACVRELVRHGTDLDATLRSLFERALPVLKPGASLIDAIAIGCEMTPGEFRATIRAMVESDDYRPSNSFFGVPMNSAALSGALAYLYVMLEQEREALTSTTGE